MFAMGWFVVLLGVVAIRLADGRFPFRRKIRYAAAIRFNHRRIAGVGFRPWIGLASADGRLDGNAFKS